MQTLTNEQLSMKASAIFATAPHAKASERYSFVPTITVVDALRSAGWNPVFAGQSIAKDAGRSGLQRHVVRFQHDDVQPVINGVVPELLLINSHDLTSAFQLHAGLFRFVCGNGMVVADATFEKISLRHQGLSTGEIIDASFRVLAEMPKLAAQVDGMRAMQLTAGEQEAFASAAAIARWGDEPQAEARALLQTRRSEDRGDDMWNTFNRVQENLTKGGVRGTNTEGKRRRVRGVKSVSEDTKLNKALWHLAEEFRRMKSGESMANAA
jgi:hypothetical protein